MMKITQSLALLLSLMAPASATHVSAETWNVSASSIPAVSGSLSVGSSLGEGQVTVAPETVWTLPGALFLGGAGYYSGAPNTGAHDGLLRIGPGATLTVGGLDDTANGAQSHVNVGNSLSPITGTLEIDGGRLQAEQLVVGYNAGTGVVRVRENGRIVLTNEKPEVGRPEYNGLLIGAKGVGRNSGSGLVQLQSGSVLESAAVFTSIGTQGKGQLLLESGSKAHLGDVYVGESSGGQGLLSVSQGALLECTGSLLISASGALEMENAAAVLGRLYVDSGRVTVKGGTLRTDKIALNEEGGAPALLRLNGQAVAETKVLHVGRGSSLELADEARCLVTQSLQLLPGSTLRMHVGEGTGLILAPAASGVAAGTVVLTMEDELLPELMQSEAELCVVSSSEPLSGTPTIYWNRKGTLVDITSAVCPEEMGLVLRPQLIQGLQAAMADSLLQPATGAAVNTLNGTLAAAGTFLRTVRAQNGAPQMAPDGRLLRADAAAARVWAVGMGAWERLGTATETPGYHYSGGGYAVGGETACAPHLCVGAALGRMHGRYRAPRGLMHDSQSLWEAALNLRYARAVRQGHDVFRLDVCAAGGLARNRARAAFYEGGDAATGRWSDKVFGAGLLLSYDWGLTEQMNLSPFIGAEIQGARQGHVMMSAERRTLHYHHGRASVCSLPLGFSWQSSLSVGQTQYLVPRLSIAYLRDFDRRAPRASTSWQGGSGRARGTKPGRDGLEAETGVLWMLTPSWSVGGAFSLQYREAELIRRVRASVDYSF